MAPPPLGVPAPAGPATPGPEFYAALGLTPREPLTPEERELVSSPAKYFSPHKFELLVSEQDIQELKRERGIPEFDLSPLRHPKIVSKAACPSEACQFTEPNEFGYVIGYTAGSDTTKLFLVDPAGQVVKTFESTFKILGS